MASSSTNKEHPLPHEIVQEILLQVPLKTLIRCISVCTSWHSLIKSSTFITSRSKHQLITNNKLLFTLEGYKGSYSLLSNAFTQLGKTNIPFKVVYTCCFITSCNGLLCVDLRATFSYRHIFLWNPSVRRFKSVDTICVDRSTTDYALGLDEFRNEYKVVKIYGKPARADVYSLTTNSWRTTVVADDLFGNKEIFIPDSQRHAHVNGDIHWLVLFGENANNRFLKSDLAILSFDFTKEVLGDFSLPTDWCNNQNEGIFEEDLKVLKGMLSFLVSCQLFSIEQSLCHVWLMKEYGVVESWTKAYTIVPGMRCYCPFGFTNTGKFVYYSLDESKLMSYDLDSENSTNVGFENSFITQVFFDFKESLILLDQGSASVEQALQDYQRTI